jgi:hypothetical protein
MPMEAVAERVAAVERRTAEAEPEVVNAVGRVSAQAMIAATTGRKRHGHTIARLHTFDIRTDLLHHTGAFVT